MRLNYKIIGALIVLLVAFAAGIMFGPSIKIFLEQDETSKTSDGSSGTWYISQMHPWIIQPQPGSCPICGMDLTPVDPDRFAGEMTIDPVVIQNMGVRIEESSQGPITRRIRTVGTVTIDPSKITDINLRFTGWVEKIHVHAQWDHVNKGDPLLDIYSPEVFSAEKEFSIALQANDTKSTLLNAARQRLHLLGIPQKEIKRLENGGTAREIVTLTAPHSGVVLTKSINNGSKVSPQTLAYQIADLTQIWVEATIYEQHLPFIYSGQSAVIKMDYGAKKSINGKISYIYPVVDRKTRETKARFIFENKDGHLKPDMFATVEISNESASMVKVPKEAVIGTGERNIIFVSLGRGRFEPRKVETGPSGNGYIGIISGIKPGEQVVVSGQFLLDSESKMREALSKVMKGDLASQQKIDAPLTDTIELTLPSHAQNSLKQTIDNYLLLQQSLYKNDFKRSSEHLGQFSISYNSFYNTARESDEHIHHKIPAMENLFLSLAETNSETIDEIRKVFGNASVEFNQVIKSLGAPTEFAGNLTGMKCSMAKGIRDGGVWIQFGPDVQNPFFGINNDMRDCAADSWGFQQHGNENKNQDEAIKDDQKTTNKSTHIITKNILSAYNKIRISLYQNDLMNAKSSSKLLLKGLEESKQDWSSIEKESHAIMHSEDLKSARIPFGTISVILKSILEEKHADHVGLHVMKCGMARGIPEKGIWIQESSSIENPYFGKDHGMSDCAINVWKISESGLVEVE